MEGSSETQASPPCGPGELEQALATFDHAAEEIRFFKGQQWNVTNYALLTYAALAAAPDWLGSQDWRWQISLLCAGFTVLAFLAASGVLKGLNEALEKERSRMDEARTKLPLVGEIHGKFPSRDWRPEPSNQGRLRKSRPPVLTVPGILNTAVLAGMVISALINVSRIIAVWCPAPA